MQNQLINVPAILEQYEAALREDYPTFAPLFDEIHSIFSQSPLNLFNIARKQKKKANRLAFLEPYDELDHQLQSFFSQVRERVKKEGRSFNEKEEAFYYGIMYSYDVLLGWMKSAYLYKKSDLNPPATPEQLIAVQAHIGHPIPPSMILTYEIANGMTSNMVQFQGRVSFMPTEEIHGAYDLLKNFAKEFPKKYISSDHLVHPILPFAQNGAGSYWFLDMNNYPGTGVHEFNHDSAWPGIVTYNYRFLMQEPHKIRRQ